MNVRPLAELAYGENMTTHQLKCWPEFFKALASGEKTFEVRKDDRGFRAGDRLDILEWDPRSQEYTGGQLMFDVTYILAGKPWLEKDYVVMGLRSTPHDFDPDADMREYSRQLEVLLHRVRTDWRKWALVGDETLDAIDAALSENPAQKTITIDNPSYGPWLAQHQRGQEIERVAVRVTKADATTERDALAMCVSQLELLRDGGGVEWAANSTENVISVGKAALGCENRIGGNEAGYPCKHGAAGNCTVCNQTGSSS